MLQGCTAWPEEFARRYRQQGYWSDITLNDMLLRSAAAAPDHVALVHGTHATVKKLYHEKGRVRLQPANAAMDPIIVDEADVAVQGVVIGVIRKY